METRVVVLLVVAILGFGLVAQAGTITYDVAAYVDTKDLLIIQGNTIQWHHLEGAAVGRWNGGDEPTVIASDVNGTPVMQATDWTPTWPNPVPDENREECDSSVFVGLVPALMAGGVTATVDDIDTRTASTVEQQPDESNDYTLIVSLTDYAPGAYWCHVAIHVDYPSPFWDVLPDTSWAFPEVAACAEAGIVGGYWDGSYRPSKIVTRGQMAIYVARAIADPMGDDGVPEPAAGTQSFPDVPPDDPSWKYVEYCYAQSVVEGYPGGNYKPEKEVDRGHMAIYVARGMVAPLGDAGLPAADPDAPLFPDVLADDPAWKWCYQHVQYLASQDPPVVEGFPDGKYHPERMVRRDQMAKYVALAFGLPL
jgi:S-layer homology domain